MATPHPSQFSGTVSELRAWSAAARENYYLADLSGLMNYEVEWRKPKDEKGSMWPLRHSEAKSRFLSRPHP